MKLKSLLEVMSCEKIGIIYDDGEAYMERIQFYRHPIPDNVATALVKHVSFNTEKQQFQVLIAKPKEDKSHD